MAILEMIGFEGYPTILVAPATLALLGKGLSTAGNTIVETVNGRTRLTHPAAVTANMLFAWSSITTVAELKRVKHWGGFRYQAKVAPAATNLVLRLRWAYGTSSVQDSTLLMASALVAATSALAEFYIEYCIDIQNALVMIWIDGVRQPDVAVPVGTVIDSLRDVSVYMGQDQSAGQQTWNDFYFVKDTSDVDGGTTLSRRLGPVRVGAVAVNSVDLPPGWTVSAGTAVDALNSKTLNTPNTPVVRSNPDESVAKIGFSKPNNTWSIQAVSIREWHFRDTATTTGIVTQLKQGATLLAPVANTANPTTPRTGSAADKLGVFNRSLDGTAWTADKLDQLEILVNSKSGG